jgi:hypothetical protein
MVAGTGVFSTICIVAGSELRQAWVYEPAEHGGIFASQRNPETAGAHDRLQRGAVPRLR